MDHTTLQHTLSRLCAQPREGGTVEFKSNLNEPKEIGQYISALANSAALEGYEQAWLVWGVENATHRIQGTTFDPFTQKAEGNQALVMWLQQRTSPRADFTFHECLHLSGRVILLEIKAARTAPIAFDNLRYIRIDSHKTKLADHPDKEARLWKKLGQVDDWSGSIVTEATLNDLDLEALQVARQRFTEYLLKSEIDTSRHEIIKRDAQSWDTLTLLNKARLAKGGKITRSALLLLGKDEAAHHLAPVDAKMSWILRNAQGGAVSSQHFGMPFLLSTERLFSRIRNVTVEHMPDGTLFPSVLQQYDTWVIREALHNAVAHQDYRLGGKINVVEYPDRLVFSNLGQFIPPSVEWMLEHQSPPEHYRNQWLIDGMIRLRMIDQVGSGIRRMFEVQRQRHFPLPDFTLDALDANHPRVEVLIPGQIMDVKYTHALMKRSELELGQVLLLDKIQKGRAISKEEAASLKRLRLIEGRFPRVFVSGKIAAATGGQAQHIRKRGFDNRYYRDLLLELIREHGPIGPEVITELFMDKLPESMTVTQKRDKVRNLTFELAHRRKLIENVGASRGAGARWKLCDKPQAKLE